MKDPNWIGTFRSRVDLLGFIFIYGVPLWGYIVTAFQTNLFGILSGDIMPINGILITHIVFFGLFLLIRAISRSISHTITQRHLIIRALGSESKILIADIEKIKRTYNPISSPAMSIKRMWIIKKGNKYAALISPEKEKEFIQALVSINPEIELVGIK